ncbi:polyprenyl synthetase family protein [Caryophanon tenue]|uniref:Farnesyl diphosphate synthase n=1 Tax=Caryophanon tenue TaxID=33978 RepID=A0A1C0YNK5_9BACL|nr:farnesyl diphosphate synthase [Caryophanon tenue]OCS88760.1 farnesyl-diphosphate synthase [Caryophanon tenue]
MEQQLQQFIATYTPQIEAAMAQEITRLSGPASLKESMQYSLDAGGKRIRPLYVLAVLNMFEQELTKGLPVAAAIEMMHTYSLIHDDLPCMDDDDFRRGKPTNHKVFGEDVAVLAGDALNSLCFGLLVRTDVSAEQKVALVELLSETAGANGMVGGQVLDMEGEKRLLNLQELEQVHINKTGALLRFSIESGAILAGADAATRQALITYAHHIGLAFQIQDDILDIEGTTEQLGKTAGKDVASEKSTYPALLTLDGAKEKLNEHYELALAALAQLTVDTTLLQQFAAYIVNRNK